MKNVISLRIASSEQHDLVRAIVEKAYAPVREIYTPRSNALSIADDASLDSLLILAFVDDIPAGSGSVYAQESCLRVSQLAVLPMFQKSGVARELLLFAEELARDRGCTEIRLNTIAETGNGVVFERLGFSVCGRSLADWCVSERFKCLTDVEMARPIGRHLRAQD